MKSPASFNGGSERAMAGSAPSRRRAVVPYRPASLAERLAYGTGMAVASLGPLLLPGIRPRTVLLGYVAVAAAAYVLACVAGMLQGMGLFRLRD